MIATNQCQHAKFQYDTTVYCVIFFVFGFMYNLSVSLSLTHNFLTPFHHIQYTNNHSTLFLRQKINEKKKKYDSINTTISTPKNSISMIDQSKLITLTIPNDMIMSDFFTHNQFETFYSSFNLTFDYKKHTINWWMQSHENTISSEILQDLTQHKKQSYANFANAFKNSNYNEALKLLSTFEENMESKSSFTILSNATVTVDGIIFYQNLRILPRSCLQCKSNKSCLIGKTQHEIHTEKQNIDYCITIAQFWGYGYYHFVGENLPRLMPVLSRFDTKNYYVHVHQKTNFVYSFLKLFGIQPQNVLSGNVFARNLLVPESIACGNTPAYLLHEMKSRLLQSLQIQQNNACNILVIKRQTRSILNHKEMIKELQANFLNCSIIEHTGNEPITQQLKMMYSASVVIAPHGAGLVNVLVCRPNTLIFEFLNRKTDLNIIYMLMSLKLGLRYFGIPVLGRGEKNSHKMIDIQNLIQLMRNYTPFESLLDIRYVTRKNDIF